MPCDAVHVCDTVGVNNSFIVPPVEKVAVAKPPKKKVVKSPTKKVAKPVETRKTATHIVKKGETIYSIAKKYGVKPDVLLKYNRKAIKVGDKVTIPIQ